MHKKPAEKKKKFFRFSLMHFFMQKWEFLGTLRRTRVQILPPTTTKRKFCGNTKPPTPAVPPGAGAPRRSPWYKSVSSPRWRGPRGPPALQYPFPKRKRPGRRGGGSCGGRPAFPPSFLLMLISRSDQAAGVLKRERFSKAQFWSIVLHYSW